ncbi:phage tail tape measure protein [Rhodopseudomonas palustris]|uniref:Phage tail tape measure protein n=1 Tax=Rhodopseudomonas palustris TaxID=1076 RepID=A0A323ULM0_RHOPL|nr:phage tail tape measure protein [Rhodopseudomonas palustris]PZA12480.1 phage tail tape measure protein [Rhodopseudomonas palustris]
MSNLDVSLRLRLVNQLAGPAKEAKKELENVGAAAKKLDGAKAGKLAADLAKTKTEAKGADAALKQVAAGAQKLGTTKADKLPRDLNRTKTEALASQRALAQIARTLQQLDGKHAERLVKGLRNATAASERLARSMRRVREEARRDDGHKPPHRPREQPGEGGGNMPGFIAAGGRAAAGYLGAGYLAYRGASGVKKSFTDFADLDRRMTRLGITADATKGQVEAATADIRALAKTYAVPVEDALKGLEALVAQGKELPEALGMMDAIVKSAQASGASIEDMSNSAGTMMTNLKLRVDELPEAFDRLAYAGKKGQFELKDMAQYFPQLAASWANVGQKGADKLADLAAATQIIRKEAGTSERTFNGIRDLLAKINTTEVQGNFKKMGVDLEAGLKKGAKEGKPLFDVLVELTEQATKGDMAKLPKLFGEIDSRTAISALINLKKEFRALRAEIQTKATGTIANDIVRVTDDAQASIDRLANSWSAAGVAVGKFVAEATPALWALEKMSNLMDGGRELVKPGNNPFWDQEFWKREKEKMRGIEPVPPVPPKSSFPGRFQQAAYDKAVRERAAKVREAEARHKALYPPTLRGPNAPVAPNYSPVPSFKPPSMPAGKGRFSTGQNFSVVPPDAKAQALASMQGVTSVIASEGAKAAATAKSIAEQIKSYFDFVVRPTIAPRLGGAAAGGASPAAPTGPAPAAPGKRASVSNNRTTHVTVNVTGAGKDGRQIGQEIGRQLAQLGNSANALFDTA